MAIVETKQHIAYTHCEECDWKISIEEGRSMAYVLAMSEIHATSLGHTVHAHVVY